MKKILLGMGYLTWIVCNLAIIYGIGWGTMKLLEFESVGEFLLYFAFGMIMLFCIVLISLLSLLLITRLFGSEEMQKKIEDKIDINI